MNRLNLKAFGGLLFLVGVLAAALFLSAWTLDYWQAWVFLAVFSASVLAITLFLMRRDPKLLERRVQAGPAAEKRKAQQIIQSLAQFAFIVTFIVPGLDRRCAWSAVPPALVAAGDVLVAIGLGVVFFVFRENTFASAVIEVDAEQRLVSTGPYKVVRHPMYAGALVMLSGVPLALGSWWGLLTILPLVAVIVLRLLDEETFLAKNLPDYSGYQKKVRHRLLPFLW
jgi:protein-S-isoprenylcysteine O-methyltransferase Ste14